MTQNIEYILFYIHGKHIILGGVYEVMLGVTNGRDWERNKMGPNEIGVIGIRYLMKN